MNTGADKHEPRKNTEQHGDAAGGAESMGGWLGRCDGGQQCNQRLVALQSRGANHYGLTNVHREARVDQRAVSSGDGQAVSLHRLVSSNHRLLTFECVDLSLELQNFRMVLVVALLERAELGFQLRSLRSQVS